MKNFKTSTLVFLIGIAVVGMTINSARAALIELDLIVGSGDKLITLDEDTGLEWLDVTATQDLSYNDALATTFVNLLGFQHATTAQLGALWASRGITLDGSSSQLDRPGIEELILKMGCTANCSPTGAFQEGLTELDIFSSTTISLSFIKLNNDLVTARDNFDFGTASKISNPTGNIGNYLLRQQSTTAAPEPGTLAIFGLGLAGLGLMRRRKRAA